MSNFSGSNDPTLPSQTPPPPTPPARLGTWLLLSLVIGYFLSIWFIVIDPGDGNGNAGALGTIGYLLFFIVFIAALVFDFRGFVSLNGAIHWRTLSGGKRFWLVLLFVFFFEILLGVYLVRAVAGYYRLTQRRPSDHLQRPGGSKLVRDALKRGSGWLGGRNTRGAHHLLFRQRDSVGPKGSQ